MAFCTGESNNQNDEIPGEEGHGEEGQGEQAGEGFPILGSEAYNKLKDACKQMAEDDSDLKMIFEDHGSSVADTMAFCTGESDNQSDEIPGEEGEEGQESEEG